jgi:putative Mg2+ transporter-C (MgtC) family protein
MDAWLADPPFFGGPGQGTRQIVELFVAFGLTSLIGLEREIQGKSAGVRTQTIVGTAAALILLVSKYGFSDVLQDGLVVVDPSRVAAQIVSGIGFLGAGIIIFRRGSVHGLTHRGGRVGVRGYRHGSRGGPAVAGRHGDRDALPHHRGLHSPC